MSSLSRMGRTAAVVMTVAALAGCAALLDPKGTQKTVQNTVGDVFDRGAADRAMTALTRGDFTAAERAAQAALKRNPHHPTALLVAGLAYQGMARYDLARQYFEVIITNKLPGTIMAANDAGGVAPRSVMEIAQANLTAIDKITGRSVPRNAGQSGQAPSQPFPVVDRPPGMSRPAVGTGALEPLQPVSASVTAPGITDAEANVAGRFRILRRLLDDGLVTQDEYARRRAVNLGGLLPFTQSPPAQGLERPIPGDEAVVRRLREIGQTLETRATTPAQHAAERATILDALLPEKPRKAEAAPAAPRDMIEAGQAVGRLERMRAAGLVGADEAKREKDAIERALDAALGGQRVAGTATGLKPGAPGQPSAQAAGAGKAAMTGWGVRLASVKSEDLAKAAWERIKGRYPEQLNGLAASYKKLDQGEKGVRWQVLAGPVASKDAASKLCKTLKLHRQACDPASL